MSYKLLHAHIYIYIYIYNNDNNNNNSNNDNNKNNDNIYIYRISTSYINTIWGVHYLPLLPSEKLPLVIMVLLLALVTSLFWFGLGFI